MTISDHSISDAHAEHALMRHGDRVLAVEALPHRVERAGADVAEHDAERGEREAREATAGGSFDRGVRSSSGDLRVGHRGLPP